MPRATVCRQPHLTSLKLTPLQVRGDIDPWLRDVIDPPQADRTGIIVDI